MLSDEEANKSPRPKRWGLNAPSGAGCFLAKGFDRLDVGDERLNAPSGAGCFLTRKLDTFMHDAATS